MTANLAPCIAVVGPANSGKTTLLHQLDEHLQARINAVLVLKGNPDGTGRYQFHAPDLREALKAEVKGQWGSATIDRICDWIDHGRRNLSIALLDFGGKHSPENGRMLGRCSHYILVSRLGDEKGAASWEEVCRRNNLRLVASMRSVGPDDPPPQLASDEAGMTGTFRFDASPGDTVNDTVLTPLTERIVSMGRTVDLTPYVDLHLLTPWTEEMVSTVAGRDHKIRELAERVGAVVLGGVAPRWAYLAGLRCALLVNDQARVFFFDPKEPERLVEIPARRRPVNFPPGQLQLSWNVKPGFAELRCELLSPDKFLPSSAAQNLAGAPGYGEVPNLDSVGLYGPGPTWLYGAYARWLMACGVRRLGSWDGRKQGYITVWAD